MRIFTDDPEFASVLLDRIDDYHKTKKSSITPDFFNICNAVFPGERIFIGEEESIQNWSALLVVRNTSVSHIELIADLIHNNIELPDRLLILAREGTGFTGYNNRSWIAADGNLHLTALLKPGIKIEHFTTGFTILSALSVLETIDMIADLKEKFHIRWVNDIVKDNNKVAGVLTRTQLQGDIVSSVQLGIGLNVTVRPEVKSDPFVPGVICLTDYHEVSLSQVFKTLLIKLFSNYNHLLNGDYERLLQQYMNRSVILNRFVSIYSDPKTGPNELVLNGKVIGIGKNLELYFENMVDPITRGRVVIR